MASPSLHHIEIPATYTDRTRISIVTSNAGGCVRIPFSLIQASGTQSTNMVMSLDRLEVLIAGLTEARDRYVGRGRSVAA